MKKNLLVLLALFFSFSFTVNAANGIVKDKEVLVASGNIEWISDFVYVDYSNRIIVAMYENDCFDFYYTWTIDDPEMTDFQIMVIAVLISSYVDAIVDSMNAACSDPIE